VFPSPQPLPPQPLPPQPLPPQPLPPQPPLSPIILSLDVEEDPYFCISRLGLYHDKAILQSTEWLNAGIIHAGMTFLREQTKKKHCGWQNMQPGGFKPTPPNLPFEQLLHVRKCHWVTASNCQVVTKSTFIDTVRIYDSDWGIGLITEVKRAVCSFFHCRQDMLHFEFMDVAKQQNANGCGVFALAFTTDPVHDVDPTRKQWDHQRMRQHLSQCLEREEMTCFPTLMTFLKCVTMETKTQTS